MVATVPPAGREPSLTVNKIALVKRDLDCWGDLDQSNGMEIRRGSIGREEIGY